MAESLDEIWMFTKKQCINRPSLSIFIGLAVTTVTYYLTCVVKKPLLITGSRSYADFLQRRCPVLVQQYYPTVWCFTSRAHTIVCAILSDLMTTFKKLPCYRRDVLPTPDGGEIHLDWLDHHGNGHHDNRTRPIVVILPGLSGHSGSGYVIRLAEGAHNKGYRSVVFNFRGTNGTKLKTSTFYCAADTTDTQHVVSYIMKLYPDAPLMAVGASLGGMILFNYVAKYGKDCGLVAAMVASMPWDAAKTTESLEEPVNWLLFNTSLVRGLRRDILLNREVFDKDSRVDVDHILKSSTVAEIDERFTIKLFGFKSVHHFYTTASACNKVHQVQIPLLCLNAADDVFAPFSSIPTEDIKKNQNIALVVTSHGGHIGFGDWLFPVRESFMDKLYQQYLNAVFKYGDEELLGKKKREHQNGTKMWTEKIDQDISKNEEKATIVRTQEGKSPKHGVWACSVCARVCGSRIGLYSHQRTHREGRE